MTTYFDPDLMATAADVQQQIWGDLGGTGGQRFPAGELAPDFSVLSQEWAFGMVWSRPGLALRDRSIATVAQLAALGRMNELKIHLRGAINLGIEREELVEILIQTAVYAGLPAAVGALTAAAEVLGVPGDAA